MDIKNKSGDVLGKIQIESLRKDSAIDRIVIDLKPGEGKAIYTADATENQFTQQTNYAAIPWEDGLEQLQKFYSPWQPKFPIDSDIDAIHVFYGFDNLTPQEIDEMIEESNRLGRNVVIRDLKPNKKVVGISITYKEYGGYKLNIFGTTKSRIALPDHDGTKVKQVALRGVEAFYIFNNETSQLIWIEEDVHGKALQYEIIGRNMSEDLVMEITNSMNG
ncbi:MULTISPECIES: hypothetical protein [unclassified Paenibacillus]|uniref:hypothetical protein n=1 Tax=unclassified Paenibacillus TaxID=185978 RepID=UPI000CFB06B4|nr:MULTISPECIES: hypothetical protein [unclassified Paenibacillus]PRA09475.1 hypothetical protein CQ043_05780 [Paenibacillus sp. MYb63]PRA46229.1 hypothetical protein CQ061_19795 [Paenibacillus sp. MYb67]QZN73702.1 hypothetical protein K5K90_19935 [Paenibacillus sp. DR312]